MITECYGEYSLINQDKSSYAPDWDMYNSTYTPNTTYANIYQSFQYTSSSQINSYPYTGSKNTYFGGGYVFKMKGSINDTKANLSILEELKWIDKQTSAVFIEFTLYNANTNLFQSCMILFEIDLAGTFTNTIQFTSLNLYEINKANFFTPKILLSAIYLMFVVIIMAIEVKHFIRLGWRKYLSDFYNYLELIVIAFSWAAFSMFLYRMYAAYDVGNQINKSFVNSFINLQNPVYFSMLYYYFLGICAAFSCLRFIRTLRYIRRIMVFFRALTKSCKEMISFGVVFLVAWLAYIQVFYVRLNDQYFEFHSMVKSIMTGVELILLQKSTLFLSEQTYLLAILYILFILCVIFTLVNVFLTIVTESYAMARIEMFGDPVQGSEKHGSHLLEFVKNDEENEDPELFNYLKSVVLSFFSRNNKSEDRKSTSKYVENWDQLISKINESLYRIQNCKNSFFI